MTKGKAKPHHFLRISIRARQDLRAWKYFLRNYNGVTLLAEARWITSERLSLQTDAATTHGYAAVLGTKWFCGAWPETWVDKHISAMELYPICAAVALWSLEIENACITFQCDNEAVCHAINNQSAKEDNLMALLRRLIITTMTQNIMFRAVHVPGIDNHLADALSRFQMEKARARAPSLDQEPTTLPDHLHPEAILKETYWQQV